MSRMGSVNWRNTERAVSEASEYMAKQARLELEAKRPRTSIRARWRKIGKTWQAVGNRKQKIRKNFVASGALVRSIESAPDGTSIGISALWYAQAIIEGRKPWRGAGFNGDKGIPLSTMKKWTEVRRLRPTDPQTGEFLKNIEIGKRGGRKDNKRIMRFLMNRKIKNFGIEPFDFVGIARETTIAIEGDKIRKAIREDIIENLGTKYNTR